MKIDSPQKNSTISWIILGIGGLIAVLGAMTTQEYRINLLLIIGGLIVAAGIVYNIKTGEILAMATMGDFDLNAPFEIVDPEALKRIEAAPEEDKKQVRSNELQASWRNKFISDAYEPVRGYLSRLPFNVSGACRPYSLVPGL